MHLWHTASLVFFAYVVLAMSIRGPRGRVGLRVLGGAGAGVAVVLFSALVPQPALLLEWVWPPLVLLVAYWTSGLLFTHPRPHQEKAFARLDERWRVRQVARRVPRGFAELFEAAYAGVFLLIPAALILHLRFSANPDPHRFWAVVLLTDFVCFGTLPWIQTRPPRALETGAPWTSSLRRFNLRLLGSMSIQVNTFPSGHAAEALAVALLVADAPSPVAELMFAAAFAVAAGAVLGRYHYLADALAGWGVAVIVVAVVA